MRVALACLSCRSAIMMPVVSIGAARGNAIALACGAAVLILAGCGSGAPAFVESAHVRLYYADVGECVGEIEMSLAFLERSAGAIADYLEVPLAPIEYHLVSDWPKGTPCAR